MIRALLVILVAFVLSGADARRKWRSPMLGTETTGSLEDFTTNAGAGGICDDTVKQLSGYYSVSNSEPRSDAAYFFWMFESRADPTNDPFIIWLTGGPGCSSQLALMTENGPCTPTADGLDTIRNDYSWNNNANILWVDQPAGVGYSYGNMPQDMSHNQTEVSEHMFHFLQEFFVAHPEYQKNDFFVFGESYGGHYVPSISNRVWKGNNDNEGVHINLAGIGIGNGLTDPTVQYQYYPQMAMNNTYGIKTVSEEAYDKMVERLPLCIKLSEACQRDVSKCVGADDYCNVEETTPYYKTGLNPYDIRKPCDGDLCYNFDNVDTFLNLNSTFAALHVSDKVKTWESCNNVVNAAFASDWMREFQGMIPPMLESGVRALIYAGDADFICNWMGNHAWTNALPWSGHDQYSSAVDVEWTYGSNVPGGMTKTAPAQSGGGSLTFLRVYGGGHMVPMDQPAAAFAMLETFLKNESFESE